MEFAAAKFTDTVLIVDTKMHEYKEQSNTWLLRQETPAHPPAYGILDVSHL